MFLVRFVWCLSCEGVCVLVLVFVLVVLVV